MKPEIKITAVLDKTKCYVICDGNFIWKVMSYRQNGDLTKFLYLLDSTVKTLRQEQEQKQIQNSKDKKSK